MRLVSCLKARRLYAFKLGYVARPLRGMNDDLNKRPANPIKSKEVIERGINDFKWALNRLNPTVCKVGEPA